MWGRFDARQFSAGILLLALLGIILIMLPRMAEVADRGRQDQCAIIEDVVSKAVLQCYALEGSYPPNLEYLRDNYGLMLDRRNFDYHYEVFASNIRPSIQIFARGHAEEVLP